MAVDRNTIVLLVVGAIVVLLVIGLSGDKVGDDAEKVGNPIETNANLIREIPENPSGTIEITYKASPVDDKYGFIIEDRAIGDCSFNNGKVYKSTIISPSIETSTDLTVNGGCSLEGDYVYANSDGQDENKLREVEI